MRLLIAAHAAVIDLNRRHYDHIVRLRPDWALRVVAPAAYRATGSRVRYCCEPLPTGRGYEIVTVPAHFARHPLTLCYARSLTRAVGEFAPDLIHIDEEPPSPAAVQLTRLAIQLGVPRIIYSSQNLLKTYPPPFRWFERYCLRHADFAFGLNQEALEHLRRKGFRGPSAVTWFGYDEELFCPLEPEERARRREEAGVRGLCVAFAGTLWEQKGILDLVAALREVQSPCTLLVLGGGPLAPQVAATRDDPDWRHITLLPGQVPHAEVARWLQLADVLVLPSRTVPSWKEQFGRVLVEAMACGTAAVGSDSGEIPHVIGDAGIVFPEGDVRLLAASLEGLATDRRRLLDLQEAGLARAQAVFRWEELARQRCVLYESVLERNATRSAREEA